MTNDTEHKFSPEAGTYQAFKLEITVVGNLGALNMPNFIRYLSKEVQFLTRA